MQHVTIFEGASDDEIAGWLETRLGQALANGEGPIAVTIPGGSTPFPILKLLLGRAIDWSRIAVWPGDDRVVPEDHAASNVGRIRALLEPAGATIVPLTEGLAPPHFALTWLGMGADGHVASLFPNTDPDPADPHRLIRLTPDPLPPEAPFDRLTLTIPALTETDALMFVMRGDDKRAVFDAALAGEHDLPVARLLRVAQGKGLPVTCFT